jgi:hypothetical protein
MRFVRINTLSLKVENALLGDESYFKNKPDCDNWIQSDTAKLNDTYNAKTGVFTSPPAYPDDDKYYNWDESTTSWKEIV